MVLVEKNSSSIYSNFILSLYIVYELNNRLCNPTNSFTLKNCIFDNVKLTKNLDKIKFTYNGWEIAFDGEGSWSFDNDFARIVVIFGVDCISLSHTDH